MRDVAQAAGVSPMTVSRALRGDGTVSQRTRDAVRAVANRLGYVYDTTAQAFRAQKSGFVAVTLPSINNANFAETHRGLTDALSDTGLQILLGSTGYCVLQEERIVKQLLERKPEALILTGGHHTDATRDLLRARDIPIVEMWDHPPNPLQYSVGFSNAQAMHAVVAKLAASGRRRLAFLGANGDTDRRGAERRAGVVSAATKLGLARVQMIGIGPAPVSMTHGSEAIVELGDKISQIDALVCVSDTVAFGALSACQRAGIRVPEDIAVTGFGAFEIASVSNPRLTTVDVSAYEIGLRAGDVIARLLLSDEAVTQTHIETQFVLCPGETF